MAIKQGLDKLPFARVPANWDHEWFIRFCREVLALADTRNAINGDGVVITGTSDEPATISASADVLALILQPYILAEHTALLPNERLLVGQSGFITATDGGPDGDFTIGIDQGMNPVWTGTHQWQNPLYGPLGTAALPSFSASQSRHAGVYFPDFNVLGLATNSTLQFQIGEAGQFGIGGATYGTADVQAVVSGGSGAPPTWQTVLVDGQTQTLSGDKTWTGNHDFNGNQTRFTGTFAAWGAGSGVEIGMASPYGFPSGFMLCYDRTGAVYRPFAFEGDFGAFLLSEGGIAQFSGNTVNSTSYRASNGVEIGLDSTGTPIVRAVDRPTAAFSPLGIVAEFVDINDGGTNRGTMLYVGGARLGSGPAQFTGQFGTPSYDPNTAPGVEFGYSSGFSGAFMQAYNWGTTSHIPFNIAASEIGFRIGGAYDLGLYIAPSRAIQFPAYGAGYLSTDASGNITAGALPAYPAGANPSASVGLAAVNGSALTFLRSDGAPALDQAIAPTWTGHHTFSDSYGGPSLSGSDILLEWNQTSGGSDQKLWWARANSTAWQLQTRTDGGGLGKNILVIGRGTGTAIASMAYGNATDNPPHTFYGQITETTNILAKTSTTYTNGAAAAAGTLLNAPAAGNPTKWIPINDNGTTRYIPAW